jgi:hypothetical protein
MTSAVLIQILLVIVVVGLIVWVVVRYIPMEPIFKNILIAVAAIVLILYLARVFGVF